MFKVRVRIGVRVSERVIPLEISVKVVHSTPLVSMALSSVWGRFRFRVLDDPKVATTFTNHTQHRPHTQHTHRVRVRVRVNNTAQISHAHQHVHIETRRE